MLFHGIYARETTEGGVGPKVFPTSPPTTGERIISPGKEELGMVLVGLR